MERAMRLPLIPICLMVVIGMAGCDNSDEPAKVKTKPKDWKAIRSNKREIYKELKGLKLSHPCIVENGNVLDWKISMESLLILYFRKMKHQFCPKKPPAQEHN